MNSPPYAPEDMNQVEWQFDKFILSDRRIQNEVTPDHDSGGPPPGGGQRRPVLVAGQHQELAEAVATDPTAERRPSARRLQPAGLAAVPLRSAARAAAGRLPGKGQSRFSKPQPQRPPPMAMLQELYGSHPSQFINKFFASNL